MTENNSLYNGISKIAWGFVFILFHFKINTIDLLPDFVGYILIALAIGSPEISPEHKKILKPLSIVISIWTASLWFTETLTLTSFNSIGYLSAVMGYLSTVMGVAILIFTIILLTDLSVIAVRYQPENKNIDRQLIVARNIYAVCYSVSLALSISVALTRNIYPEILTGIATALSLVIGIAMLVTMVIILVSLFSLRKIIMNSTINQTYGTYDIPPFRNENTPPYGWTEATVNEEENKESDTEE